MNPSTNHRHQFLFLGLAWLFTVMLLVLSSFLGLFTEHQTPPWTATLIYTTMALMGYGFFLNDLIKHPNTKGWKILLWPLHLLSWSIFTLLMFLGLGGTVLWFVLFLFPLEMIGLPIAMILGFIYDQRIKQSKN